MSVVTLPVGTDRLRANAYLCTGAVPTLVDAGSSDDLVASIRDHVDRLDRVVLTHQHGDHVHELEAVLDAFDADLLAHGDHPRRTAAIADGDAIAMGDAEATVVHTPGHADDHVSLVLPDALVSGDAVVYNDAAFDDGSFGRTDLPGQSREELIDALERLLERLPATVETLYPGHGDVYRASAGPDSVYEVVERALRRAERREPKYPEE